MKTLNGQVQIELTKKKPIKNKEGVVVNEGAVEEYAKVVSIDSEGINGNKIKKGDTVYFMGFSVYRLMDEKGKELAFIEAKNIIAVK